MHDAARRDDAPQPAIPAALGRLEETRADMARLAGQAAAVLAELRGRDGDNREDRCRLALLSGGLRQAAARLAACAPELERLSFEESVTEVTIAGAEAAGYARGMAAAGAGRHRAPAPRTGQRRLTVIREDIPGDTGQRGGQVSA